MAVSEVEYERSVRAMRSTWQRMATAEDGEVGRSAALSLCRSVALSLCRSVALSLGRSVARSLGRSV
eukprot:COSAG02_NODE_15233_length_1191_cov_2.809524_2_plen_67_part_00